MIVSFLNQRGGVGKTTLSINVATCLSLKGFKVLLIDADPQGRALDWAYSRKKERLFTVVSIAKPIIHKEITRLAKDYDHIIIDGPARVYEVARSAIVISDLIIIPVQPSPYDIWDASEVVNLVKEVSEPLKNIKNIKCAFLINRKIVNTPIGKEIENALIFYKIDVFQTHICQRIAYAESAAIGSTVIEYPAKDFLAAKEIASLVAETLQKYNK